MTANRPTRLLHPLVGAATGHILAACWGKPVHPKHYPKLGLTLLASIALSPLRWYERLRFDRSVRRFEIQRDPIFIVGHWRSGTTYLHNALCQDPRFSYVTTFQSVFPEYLLGSKLILLPLLNALIPEKRPMDNVALKAEFPQEDEVALGAMSPFSLFHYLIFPEDLDENYQKSVSFENVSRRFEKHWKRDYTRLIKKAIIDAKKEQFISKNPPNTGRIRTLLELFPNAKFVHIYRNPIIVILSTKKCFSDSMSIAQLTRFDHSALEEQVLHLYERIMNDFFRDRRLIPSSNYVDVRFEDFERAPLNSLREIYDGLGLEGFADVEPVFSEYVESQKDFEKNIYHVKSEELRLLVEKLKFTMDQWGYEVPSEIVLQG